MYIGLDVGTRFIGWAVVDAYGQHIKSGWKQFGKGSKLKDWEALLARLGELTEWAECFFSQHDHDRIELVGIEYPYQGKNAQSALKLGMAWGIMAGEAMRCGFRIERIHPTQAKAAMTGSGKALKTQMVQYAGYMGVTCEGPGAYDQADAIGVALAVREIHERHNYDILG